jgi:predicted metal-binding protein
MYFARLSRDSFLTVHFFYDNHRFYGERVRSPGFPRGEQVRGKDRLHAVRRDRPVEFLRQNAEKYSALAVGRGALEASAVAAAQAPVDDRAAVKRSIPKRFGYGTSVNRPPHSMKPEETRKLLSPYRCGVAFRLKVPPEVIVRDRATIAQRVEARKKVFEIASSLESAAFYDGYYLVVGFAAGSCKSTYRRDKPCAVLGGDKCRNTLRSRPSMEAVGIDCYRLASELGWDIFPIGSDAKAECFSYGSLTGLVLVN